MTRFTITTQGNFKTSSLLVVKEFLKNMINSEKLGITLIIFIHLFSQQEFIEHPPCASLVLGTRKPQYMEHPHLMMFRSLRTRNCVVQITVYLKRGILFDPKNDVVQTNSLTKMMFTL